MMTVGMFADRSWIGDKLTATVTSLGQSLAVRHASRITQSPITTISPFSSAIGMNSAGEIAP